MSAQDAQGLLVSVLLYDMFLVPCFLICMLRFYWLTVKALTGKGGGGGP